MAAGNTFTPIATYSPTGNTITFSSFSSGYTDLFISIQGTLSATDDVYMRFNSLTSNNSQTTMAASGTSAVSNRTSNEYVINLTNYVVAGTNSFSIQVNIFNYSSTSVYKTSLIRSGNVSNATEATAGMMRSTDAITSITIYTAASESFTSGSKITLYGIQAA